MGIYYHILSGAGRHLKTIDLDTGVVLYTFGYDPEGRLVSIMDRFTNQVTIQRDGNGVPTAIVSADGITTNLFIDAENHLTTITYPDTSVYGLFGQDTKRKALAKADIQKRVGLAFVNEAARCLEDGILRSPRDGDIGAIFGLGFPPFRGGPFSYVDHVGASEVHRRLEQLAERVGPRFAPAQIIQDYAKGGKKFR